MNKSKNKFDFRNNLKKNSGIILIIYLALMFFAALRIFHIAAIKKDDLEKRKDEIYKNIAEDKPMRGSIYDTNYNLLATTVPKYRIAFDPVTPSQKNFEKYIDSLSIKMHEYFNDKSPKEYKEFFIQKRKDSVRYIELSDSLLSYSEMKTIKGFPLFRLSQFVGGFIKSTEPERVSTVYPMLRRTLGILSKDSLSVEKSGVFGLEQKYESRLKGESGKSYGKYVPGKGVFTEEEGEIIPRIPPQDLVTAIDINLQDFVHRELKKQLVKVDAKYGIAVVMEVETGYIKAMANLGYKPGDSLKNYFERRIYAAGVAGPPGSTFKAPVMLSVLEDSNFPRDTVLDMGGTNIHIYFGKDTIRDDYAIGKISIKQTIEKSSNLAMAHLVYKTYYQKGKYKRFLQRLHDFGFGRTTGIDLKGEQAGFFITEEDPNWSEIVPMRMAFGYVFQATPLQILNFYAAIANDGKLMQPQIVRAFVENGQTIENKPKVKNPGIAGEANIKFIQNALIGVVENGTAKNIKSDDYKIAGKTGTARLHDSEKGYRLRKYEASFVGYFPADKPKYACIVVINEPDPDKEKKLYYGSTAAAPLFKRIADRIYYREIHPKRAKPEGIEPTLPLAKNGNRNDLDITLSFLGVNRNDKNSITNWVKTFEKGETIDYKNLITDKKIVPDVRQMTVKDAVFLLEARGIKVKFKGRGSVKKQSVEPGTKVKRGMVIHLSL